METTTTTDTYFTTSEAHFESVDGFTFTVRIRVSELGVVYGNETLASLAEQIGEAFEPNSDVHYSIGKLQALAAMAITYATALDAALTTAVAK